MRKRHLTLIESSGSLSSEPCPDCGFIPTPDGCACGYIESLMPGNRNEHLASRALAAAKSRHNYEMSCPCPSCYMQRLWSFAPPAARPERKDL